MKLISRVLVVLVLAGLLLLPVAVALYLTEPPYVFLTLSLVIIVLFALLFFRDKISGYFFHLSLDPSDKLERSVKVVRYGYYYTFFFSLAFVVVGGISVAMEASNGGALLLGGVLLSGAALYSWRTFPPNIEQLLMDILCSQVVLDRGRLYIILWHLTNELEQDDEVLITSFEHAPIDYVDESPESTQFMRRWQSKIRECGISVKHMIRLFNEPKDIDNLKNRIEQYSTLPTYQIGVLIAPPPRPFVDLYIVSGKYAVIGYSTSAAAPHSMSNSICVTEIKSVQSIEKWFTETLWANCEPLKDSFRTNTELLGRLEYRTNLLNTFDSAEFWNNFPEYLLAKPIFLPVFESFFRTIKESASLRSDEVPPLLVRSVEEKVKELAAVIKAASAAEEQEYRNPYKALSDIPPPDRSIEAISVLDNEAYWLSQWGQKQMSLETELVDKGVLVKRICIVAGMDRLSESMEDVVRRFLKYIRSENLTLIERNVVTSSLLPAQSADFALMDRACVIRDHGEFVTASFQKGEVTRFVGHFQSIQDLANQYGVHFVNKQKGGVIMSKTPSRERRTVVELDLVGYSSVARALEENLDSDAVASLNSQINAFVDDAIQLIGKEPQHVVLKRTGDGAILGFSEPDDAHKFAKEFFRLADDYNSKKTEQTAKRRFRMGAASGHISFIELDDGSVDMAGTTIANAVRLEAAGKPGAILVDRETFQELPSKIKQMYSEEFTIPGKRDEMFYVRSYTFSDMGDADSVVLPHIPKSGARREIVALLEELERDDEIDLLQFLIEMPLKDRPSRSIRVADKRAEILAWADTNDGCGLETLQAELEYLKARNDTDCTM